MSDTQESRLKRLQDEYRHTMMLLKSQRLSEETRRILEALRADLERQIASAEF